MKPFYAVGVLSHLLENLPAYHEDVTKSVGDVIEPYSLGEIKEALNIAIDILREREFER